MARQKTERYTAQEKRDVLRLASEIGAATAAKRLNIQRGTLNCWWHKD